MIANFHVFITAANMIAVVMEPLDNLISLAVKEQWNSKGKNCLA